MTDILIKIGNLNIYTGVEKRLREKTPQTVKETGLDYIIPSRNSEGIYQVETLVFDF